MRQRGFAAATTFDPVPGTTNAIAQLAVADLDGDTLLDLAVPQINGPQAGRVSVAIGRGNGQFDLLRARGWRMRSRARS